MENVTPAPFHGQVKKIKINGKKVDWPGETMSYDQLFRMAYPEIDTVMNFSAAYEYPQNIDKRDKIFSKGEIVEVFDGMIFNIHNTSNA